MAAKLSTSNTSGIESTVREFENPISVESRVMTGGSGVAAGYHGTAGLFRAVTQTRARASERRAYPRVRLELALCVQRVAGQRNKQFRSLQTRDISSSGVYFMSPGAIQPGTPVDLEFVIVDRPLGKGTVKMRTEAHVVRSSRDEKSGLHGIAAAFDDIRFIRDDSLPSRFNR